MVHLIGGPLHGQTRHDIDIEGALLGARIPIQTGEMRFVEGREDIRLPRDATFQEYEVRAFFGTFYLCWPSFTPEEEQPGLLERHLNNPGAHNIDHPEIVVTDEVRETFTEAFDREIRAATADMRRDEQRATTTFNWTDTANAEGGQFTEDALIRGMRAIRENVGYQNLARLTNVT